MKLKYTILALAAMTVVANAATIAANFSGRHNNANGGTDSDPLLLTQTGASAGTAAGVNGTTTFQDILTNSVASNSITGTGGSSADVIWSANGTWSKTASGSRTVAGENASGDLTDGHIESESNTGSTITITNIVTGGDPTYDLYVYLGDDAGGRTGQVSVGGTSIDYTSQIFDGTFDLATGSDAAGDYVVFSGLSGTSQTITFGGDDNANRTGVVGFEIVTVPEPSSTALLGLGGLALILRRRK